MKPLVIYHRTDFDGKCSAAVAAAAYQGDVDFYGFNHYDEIDWTYICEHKEVIMVDISFPEVSDMLMLNNQVDLIWIDHHITAIEKHGHLEIKGLQEVGKAACQLCWDYFFPHLETPFAVKHLGLYDIWNHEDKHTLPFQYGMRYLDIQADDQETWKRLFFGSVNTVSHVLETGETCFNFEKTSNAIMAKSSFEGSFEGHQCIFLNAPNKGSLVFKSVGGEDYDIMVVYNYNGKHWSVTLYSDGRVNVGEIAKKYGGGGHAGAAGFKSDKCPFDFG